MSVCENNIGWKNDGKQLIFEYVMNVWFTSATHEVSLLIDFIVRCTGYQYYLL